MRSPSELTGMDLGNWHQYPKGYDRAVHGRYDPAKYYGKPDTPFGQVKLCDLPSWFGRREKGPVRFAQMLGRAYWRWQHSYILPKKSGVAPFFQVAVCSMIFFYFVNYPRLRLHTNYKYH